MTKVDIVDGFSHILEAMDRSISTTTTELRDRILELLNGSVSLFESSTEDDGLTASGARHLRVVCKPSRRLVELARAMGAGEFDLSGEHDQPP